jgi:hypothetical protein
MARPYRVQYGVGGGPFAFDSRIRLADGYELSAEIVRADTPMDAARRAERAHIDFIRRQIRPPVIVVVGPFGLHAFPTDSAWRGRRRAEKETAALFDGR